MNFKPAFFLANNDEVYLDSAATTKRLVSSVNKTNQYYKQFNANVHRGGYKSAITATTAYEQSRDKVRELIKANLSEEIVFTSGATESINLVANGLYPEMLSGKNILILESEHHANFLPWLAFSERFSLNIIPVKLGKKATFFEQELEQTLDAIDYNTALVVCAQVSNAIGNLYPIQEICRKAQFVNALTIVDGTQAIAHMEVDVQTIGCDFYAFSGHKMFASTGIGILYGKHKLLETMRPSKLGGEMITKVTWDSFDTQPSPLKFEAGTGNIAAAIGLSDSVEFLLRKMNAIKTYELELFKYLLDSIKPLYDKKLLMVYGNVSRYFEQNLSLRQCACVPILSFNIDDIHCYDVASYLSQYCVAVRAGHHCAMPLMQSLEIEGCVRVSLVCYNEKAEIDLFVTALHNLLNAQLKKQSFSNNHGSTKIQQSNYVECSYGKSIEIDVSNKVANLLNNYNKTHIALKNATEWSEMHRQILLFSKFLPLLGEQERTKNYEINGCEANVWLKIEKVDNAPCQYFVQGYSNSKVVRGILAILIARFYTSPEEDFNQYLHQIGLTQYFSEGRRDGINKIIRVLMKAC